MDTKKLYLSLTECEIIITGLVQEVHIPLEGDIDLTNFVNELYILIDEDCSLELIIADSDNFDEKATMIVDVIKLITEKYNEAIADEETKSAKMAIW